MAPLALSNGAMSVSAPRSRIARLLLAALLCAMAALSPAESATTTTLASRILAGAKAEAARATPYIMEYEVLEYPGGDVTEGTGVCTDLVVRALRNAGIDLQKEISVDRQRRPAAYPKIWANHNPDRNIDHRRCPNQVAWLKHHAKTLPTDIDADALEAHWQPGDIVFYVRDGATHPWHVGIVSDQRDTDGMPFIIDSYPPHTTDTHRLDHFGKIHSHFRMKEPARGGARP